MMAEAAVLRADREHGAPSLTNSLHTSPATLPHAERGVRLLAGGRDAEALISLRKAVAHGNAHGPTVLNLALAEQRAGDRQRAETLMEELERRYPGWDEPPLRLAELFRAAEASSQAENAYRRVLELSPKRPEALIGLISNSYWVHPGQTNALAKDMLCLGAMLRSVAVERLVFELSDAGIAAVEDVITSAVRVCAR